MCVCACVCRHSAQNVDRAAPNLHVGLAWAVAGEGEKLAMRLQMPLLAMLSFAYIMAQAHALSWGPCGIAAAQAVVFRHRAKVARCAYDPTQRILHDHCMWASLIRACGERDPALKQILILRDLTALLWQACTEMNCKQLLAEWG